MDLRQEVVELIFRVAKIGKLKLNRQLAQKGLTLPQYFVMKMLYKKTYEEKKPISPADLSTLTGISRSTMTGIIDRLEKNCLLDRKQNPQDRRSQNIEFTEKGLNIVQDLSMVADEIRNEPLKALSEEQLLNLRDDLILIENYLKDHEDGDLVYLKSEEPGEH
ncbi:MarR family winged helix-turn-helix transcriptional regulator [Sporolactobacillus putidus]|uniref:HTH marR-type domain-containing protein n=1 Tax=Sporolactobacillus putidus TaxID=492735 RepID=A0A917S2U4_9BACL|nr:MarR family transcriptional regulator [Sporolactobacillus putidus]GGL54737.1 hypothetical protein GCM10007968_18500 [Sporolactobacillus putidus]